MDLNLMHTLGNRELLALRKVAFLSSRNAPLPAVRAASQWAARRREAGDCIISGFHSPIEKEVLQQLLPGRQPIVVVLARGLGRPLEEHFGRPLDEGRLLVLTRYAESVTHPSEESCYQRNRLMVELADEMVIGFASPGGKLERLCREIQGKTVHFLCPPHDVGH